MSTAAVLHFRIYELPWTPSPTEERRFRLDAPQGLHSSFRNLLYAVSNSAGPLQLYEIR